MKLQSKAIILLDFFLIVACVCLGILGYRSANQGLDEALQMKADSNVDSFMEMMDLKFPGQWRVEGSALYKGEAKISDSEEVVDFLGGICKGHVTFFIGDTRTATTVRDASGKRAVGTKCSQRVADTVLKQGKSFVGRADVLGEEFLSAYEPLKDGSGQIIGMIYVGLSAHEFDGIRGDFIRSVLLAMAIIVFVTGSLAYLVLGRALKPLEMLTERLQKIADGICGVSLCLLTPAMR